MQHQTEGSETEPSAGTGVRKECDESLPYLIVAVDDPKGIEPTALDAGDKSGDTALVALAEYLSSPRIAGASLVPLFPEAARLVKLTEDHAIAVPARPGRDNGLGGINVLHLAPDTEAADLARRLVDGRTPFAYAHRPAVRSRVDEVPAAVPTKRRPGRPSLSAIQRCGYNDHLWPRLDIGGFPVPIGMIDQGGPGDHHELDGRVPVSVPASAAGHSPNATHAALVAAVLGARRDAGGGDRLYGCCSAPIHLYDAFTVVGDYDPCAYYRAYWHLREAGVRVINVSLGCPERDQTEERVIKSSVEAGIAIVAAAGRPYDGQNQTLYPAAIPGVICVGGTDGVDRHSSKHANTGAHVFIAAPAEGIQTTLGSTGYCTVTGTSYGTPMVAAAAWLALRQMPTLTLPEIRSLLRHSVKGGPKEVRSDKLGWGRLDVGRMADLICAFKGC